LLQSGNQIFITLAVRSFSKHYPNGIREEGF